jgi:glycosyltransferase involved in cell wall biosynthesis
MSPRVTVIIPTWNWSSVLPFSIGSVLRQTFSELELLVIGDGCTDDSEAVVRAIEDPRVRWINIARCGHQSGPNNEGLRQAKGELIAYLGHDDLWLPHHLELAVAAIDAGADLTHSLVLLVDEEDRASVFVAYAGGWIPPTSVVHRKETITAVGGWPDYRTIRTDPEHVLWMRAAAAGARRVAIPRLTAVKFPASRRRDVYRTKPSAQQEAWTARILREPDFEAVELGRQVAVARPRPSLLQRFVGLLMSPSRWRGRSRKGEAIRASQRYKGAAP